MGAVLSFFFTDPSFDIPDPATGLTPRERKAVTDTWAVVQTDLKGNGVAFFLAFFDAFPHYQKMFRSFADVPRAELEKDKRLAAHSSNVMYALSNVVANLEDPECLVETLVKLGESHGRRNITRKEFENLQIVLLKFLKDRLGSRFTKTAEEAWVKTLNVAVSVITKGIVEGQKEAK